MPTPTHYADHTAAIDALQFVHEHLPTDHAGNGSWFVPKNQFNRSDPTLRVVIDRLEMTHVYTFNDSGVLQWSMHFDSNIPGYIVNRAVYAAMESLPAAARAAQEAV